LHAVIEEETLKGGEAVSLSSRNLLRKSIAPLVVAGTVLASTPGIPPVAASSRAAVSAANDGWPLFGRDRNNTRFSPLTQIDASNVGKLGVAWTASLGQYQVLSESYPQVIGNTMYVTTNTDEILAIDATSGKLLWRYASPVDFSLSTGVGGYGVSVNRGVAVDNGKVYIVTFDGKLQAITQDTGERLWQSVVADPRQGYYETMAPTVWNGIVFAGSSGSQDGVRGFVSAFDANTGKLLWRFYTVPAPGNGWVPKGRHGGGAVYMPPTVDTSTGLVYVGTGTPSPVLLGTGRAGANLYTDSILALQAKTGKLAWYYQETPHDQWSYGAASPSVLFDASVNGATVHAVGEAGKNGNFYILNAKTGRLLFAPIAYVKINHPVPTTKGVISCPGTVGGSPYSPVAYSPLTRAAYISGIDLCFKITVTASASGGERDFAGTRAPVGKPKGTLSAVDVNTGTFIWKRSMGPMIGGASVTASHILFTSGQDGTFYAIDDRTGKTLWMANVGLATGSAPIMYAVNGTEYVAIVLGGSAVTGAQKLGRLGATVLVLKLGGGAVTPLPSPGVAAQ
jgi:alcohol dehydrogenase (cytochrome c)